MKNIWKIIKDDFKKLFSNAISMCVVVGLICVPTIYSLFNIAGYWDPYVGTSQLQIGIVNQDQGFETDVWPVNIQFGDYVCSELNENKDFNWVNSDYDSAMDKLYACQFYAVLVFPQDFSTQFTNILSGKSNGANVIYYSNQKNSPITPKLIDNGITTIQNKINTSFSASVYEGVLKMATKLTNDFDSNAMTRLTTSLTNSFTSAKSEIDNFGSMLETLKAMLKSLNSTLDVADSLLPDFGNKTISELYEKLNTVRMQANMARQYIDNAKSILEQLGILQDFQQLLTEMSYVCSNIEDIAWNSQKIIDDAGNLNTNLENSLSSLKDFSKSLNDEINNLEVSSADISKDLQTAIDKISVLSQSSTIDDVKKILGDNPSSFAQLISSPVVMDRHELYPIENFGSAISGFFISLSCWAGCLILCTMLITKLSRKRQKKMEKLGNFHGWQLYFGRYAIFGSFALAQSTLMCLGAIFFLQIKMAHPFMFLLTGWLVSLCFSFFIYTLVCAFGSGGKVIAVILLVLQVAATGGTFPIVMITDIYQVIYPYLPVTYTIKAFNMCIAGFSDVAVYWQTIGIVFFSMTVISLIIGLVLRVPNEKISNWFEEKLHSTKLFAI